MSKILPAVLASLLLALIGLPAAAQQPAVPSTGDSPQELAAQVDAVQLQGLIDTLDDPERRAIFLERLRTLVAVQTAETQAVEGSAGLAAAVMSLASSGVDSLAAGIESILGYMTDAPVALNNIYAAVMDADRRDILLEVIGKVIGVFLAALLASFIVRRLLTRPRQDSEQRSPDNLPGRALLMLISIVIKLVPLAAFLAVAYLALLLIDPQPITRTLLLSLVSAHVISQAFTGVAGVLLAVDSPQQRLYELADETAAYCYVWVRRLAVLAVYGYFVNQALLLIGMESAAQALLVDITGLLLILLLIVLIMQNRGTIARAIRGGSEVTGAAAQFRNTLAALWHIVAIVYVIGVYTIWAIGLEGGFSYLLWRTVTTLIIIVVTRITLSAAQRAVGRLFHLPPRLREQYPGLEARADRYRPVVVGILKAFLVLIAVLAILQTWSLGVAGLIVTETGQALLARLLRILLILAGSFLIWEVISALIERKLHAKEGRSRRVVTILPLLRNIVRIVIATIGIMIVLSEMGLNIGPLIASAGVIGLAVGFGAQTLVRDLISGLFVVFEDIIAVGDWVEVGVHSGIVESMSIRTLKLRDVTGNIRILPFGEVTNVHKVANDYSYAMMVIGVAYRENADEVMELLIGLGEEMQQDPQWKDLILEPLTIDGVNALGSSSIDIRVRFKCKPLEHWGLRREFLRRTKKLFDEKGIEIPFPHQTIYFGEDKEGGAPAANINLQGGPLEKKE